MEKMCRAVDLIEKVKFKGSPVLKPIFITVDPDRDDVKAVSKYIKGIRWLLYKHKSLRSF